MYVLLVLCDKVGHIYNTNLLTRFEMLLEVHPMNQCSSGSALAMRLCNVERGKAHHFKNSEIQQ
jgi:hypothetical protein